MPDYRWAHMGVGVKSGYCIGREVENLPRRESEKREKSIGRRETPEVSPVGRAVVTHEESYFATLTCIICEDGQPDVEHIIPSKTSRVSRAGVLWEICKKNRMRAGNEWL